MRISDFRCSSVKRIIGYDSGKITISGICTQGFNQNTPNIMTNDPWRCGGRTRRENCPRGVKIIIRPLKMESAPSIRTKIRRSFCRWLVLLILDQKETGIMLKFPGGEEHGHRAAHHARTRIAFLWLDTRLWLTNSPEDI